MRINVIDPSILTDQHLLAEYLELPLIVNYLKRSSKKLPKPGPRYTLGTGHIIFFYNKGKYLRKRYEALKEELRKRGFNLNPNRRVEFEIFEELGLDEDWIPDEEALKINQERITQRISQKPHWYRYYRVPLTELDPELRQLIMYPNKLYVPK